MIENLTMEGMMSNSGLLPVMLAALAAVGCALSARGGSKEGAEPAGKRILFIGNSYTAQIQAMLGQLLRDSPYKDATLEFITKGGATLQQHLDRPGTLDRIESGQWDYVVLQDQSQTPALPGQYQESFHQAVRTLTKAIRKAGAEPVLYMTWGRLDGDPGNPRVFPDYATMQRKLTDAYREAARRHKAMVAPVGEVWAEVRERDPVLGRALYKKDGSHPSAKGALIAACTFLQTLFGDSLQTVKVPQGITADEAEIVKQAVLRVCMKGNP